MHEGGLALVDFALRKHPTNAGCLRSEQGDFADKMVAEGRFAPFLPYSAFYVGFDSIPAATPQFCFGKVRMLKFVVVDLRGRTCEQRTPPSH
jgi:hypothetical protein